MWTRFFDMCSGGDHKLGAGTIWIEACERDAAWWFEKIFDRDPDNVTCDCCGPDYSYYEEGDDVEFGKRDWIVTAEDLKGFEEKLAAAPMLPLVLELRLDRS